MNSLVLELQQEALDKSVSIPDLLRKSLATATKLDLGEIEQWINFELRGYSEDSDLPKYRIIKGTLKAWNYVHNIWVPCILSNTKEADFLSTGKICQSIAEIYDIVSSTEGTAQFSLSIPRHLENALMDLMDAPLRPSLRINRAQFVGILDAVKNRILDWSLKLEKEGILGEGMTFSKEEKQAASHVTFNIGTMNNSQIQNETEHSSQTLAIQNNDLAEIGKWLQSLKDVTEKFDLREGERTQLLADIHTIEPQLSAPSPKKSIIKESLLSVKTILEGAAGSAIASGLLQQLPALLSLL